MSECAKNGLKRYRAREVMRGVSGGGVDISLGCYPSPPPLTPAKKANWRLS